MTDAIANKLINTSSFATKVGTDGNGNVKVYHDEAPQGVALPFVIISMADNNPNNDKSGVSQVDQGTVQIFCYAIQTYDGASNVGSKSLADAARAILDCVTFTFNTKAHEARFMSESTFPDLFTNKKCHVCENYYEVYQNR